MAEPIRCPECGGLWNEIPPCHPAKECGRRLRNLWEMAAFCERQARERTESALDALQAQVDTRSVAYTEMQLRCERAENELNQAWAVLVKVRKALGSLWPALKSVQDDIWAFSEAASEADRKARKETAQMKDSNT